MSLGYNSQSFFNKLDTNNDGVITRSEFNAAFSGQAATSYNSRAVTATNYGGAAAGYSGIAASNYASGGYGFGGSIQASAAPVTIPMGGSISAKTVPLSGTTMGGSLSATARPGGSLGMSAQSPMYGGSISASAAAPVYYGGSLSASVTNRAVDTIPRSTWLRKLLKSRE